MIRIDAREGMEISGRPASVLDLATLVSESVHAGLGDTGTVVHRITVEEADA